MNHKFFCVENFLHQIPTLPYLFVMSTPSPIKVLCISMGGDRQSYIEKMFSTSSSFRVTFIPGVPSRSIRNKEGLLNAAYKSGILTEDPQTTFLAGKPSSQTSEWDDMDYPSELWKKGKSLNRERSVLACLMAHLNAMKFAVENDYDIILEDNVRMPKDLEGTADSIRSFIASSSTANVRYFGYLGPSDNLSWLYSVHIPSHSLSTPLHSPFPFSEHNVDGGMKGTCLWGAYGYMVDRQAYEVVVGKLREDIGALMWRGKR
jgi:hypothetical protein